MAMCVAIDSRRRYCLERPGLGTKKPGNILVVFFVPLWCHTAQTTRYLLRQGIDRNGTRGLPVTDDRSIEEAPPPTLNAVTAATASDRNSSQYRRRPSQWLYNFSPHRFSHLHFHRLPPHATPFPSSCQMLSTSLTPASPRLCVSRYGP